MAYIDKSGNVCEKKQRGIIEMFLSFLTFIWLFFQSLLGLDSNKSAPATDYRQVLRGGPDGTGYRRGNDGFRRNIGRLPGASSIAPPPMGGGCCGGGGCG